MSTTNAIIAVVSLALVLSTLALAVATARLTDRIERSNPPTGRLLEIDGRRVHVRDGDASRDATIVLLHGASANLRDIDTALRAELETAFRVISIDRPGSGWSEPDADAAGDPMSQARLVATALDRLGVERAVWVGHSWGGAVALAAAVELPERVSGAVLLAAPTVGWDNGELPWPVRLGATSVLGEAFARTLVTPLGRRALDDLLADSFRPEEPPPIGRYAESTGAALSITPSRFGATARDMVGLPASLGRLQSRLDGIEPPLLLLYGERDPLMSADKHARPLAEALPHAELVVLPGAGHLIHHTRSDEVGRRVADFATGVSDASRSILREPSR